ncbi:MAG TPA: serine hydrolase domain-containing protein, partial [Pirellulales bacterium]|nr:serine hydrolase domain-containing protein [Pirellulales bacterium]
MTRYLALCASFSFALCGSTLRAAEAPDAIAKTIERFVDQHVIAGAVTLVAADGKIKSLEAIGMADLESKRPMTPDTLFWIASMTKPITATSLMILVDEGKLSLDTSAGMFLPEFNSATVAGNGTNATPVTIRHLLSHTSGVAGPGKSPSPNPTLAETAESIADAPLQFEPGSQWKYGNGLTVVGRIVEIASGQSFDAFVRDRILQPLGMNDTSFDPTPAQRTRLATIYAIDANSKQLTPTKSTAFANFDPNGPRKTPNPSGGLAS